MEFEPPEKGSLPANSDPPDEVSREEELAGVLDQRAGKPIDERVKRHLDGLHPGDIAQLEDIAKDIAERRDAEDDDFRRACAEHVPLGVPLGVLDPRLKALCTTSGHLDPAAIKGWLDKPPGALMDKLTLPVIEALGVILLEKREGPSRVCLLEHAPWLAKLPYDKGWDEAIVRLRGTVTLEREYNGEVVERTVEHHPGRADVRAYRASLQSKPDAPATAPIRASARARGAGRPRAAASRSSAASGDSGDSDSDGEPPAPALRSVRGFRHVSESLADELNRIAATLRVREGAGR